MKLLVIKFSLGSSWLLAGLPQHLEERANNFFWRECTNILIIMFYVTWWMRLILYSLDQRKRRYSVSSRGTRKNRLFTFISA